MEVYERKKCELNSSFKNCKKRKNDIFYTPIPLVLDCIRYVPIQPEDTLLDAFMGNGAFYNNYPTENKKDWCEIEMGIDFLEYNKKVDWVISNPPFSKLNIMLDKMAQVCNKGFSIIITACALTIPRLERMEKAGFVVTKYFPIDCREWNGFLCCFVLFEKNGKPLFHIKRY